MSEGLWDGPKVTVVGFPWCKYEPKEVGLGSLTAKILCRAHNSRLSPLDSSAKDAFDVLRRTMALANRRGSERARKWKRVRFQVNGPLLERWFVKTAINLACVQGSEHVWHLDDSPVAHPGSALVRLAYGLDALDAPLGLYSAGAVGDDVYFQDIVDAAPVLIADNRVVGFLFTFRGVRFLLWLAKEPPPDVLRLPEVPRPEWRVSDLTYRIAYFRWNVAGRLSHYIDFMWPGRRPPHWIASG